MPQDDAVTALRKRVYDLEEAILGIKGTLETFLDVCTQLNTRADLHHEMHALTAKLLKSILATQEKDSNGF